MSSQKKEKKSRSRQQKAKKSRSRQRTSKAPRRLPAARTIDVITEKTYVTTEPEVEIRKPATLAQALTEPAVAVVKPKSRVRKQVIIRRSRPRA